MVSICKQNYNRLFGKVIFFNFSRFSTERVEQDCTSFRVVSYNIKSEAMTYLGRSSVDPWLGMNYRLPLIMRELFSYNADIICLQEVDSKYYKSVLEPMLCKFGGYSGCFQPKADAKPYGNMNSISTPPPMNEFGLKVRPSFL